MPYAEGRTFHDADAHIVEKPDWLEPYADPKIRPLLKPIFVQSVAPGEAEEIESWQERHYDEADRELAEREIMLRKNWAAMGSFIKEHRPHALDLMGFSSQLLFNTFSTMCAAASALHPTPSPSNSALCNGNRRRIIASDFHATIVF